MSNKFWLKAEPLAGEIIPRLAEMASKWWAARLWYQEAASALSDVFGVDGRRMAFLIAALSPETRVGDDILNAIRLDRSARLRGWAGVWGEHRRHPIHRYGQQVASAFRCWSTCEPPTGAKIGPFALALVGEAMFFPHPNSEGEWVPLAVVDRHMTRPFFGEISPTEVQRRAVSLACLRVGQSMGLDGFEAVRQVQAAAWHEGAARGKPCTPEVINSLSYATILRGVVG